MKLSRVIVVFLLVSGLALAEKPADKGVRPAPYILPKEFGGWQLSGSSKTSSDPATADPVNAAVLKEYGFDDFESATYTRDDGRKLTLKAARFADASGAYGAFTYYKTSPMLVEKIGDQAASLNERVLFYRGNILMDALFDRLSAMSAAELRELGAALPLPSGNTGNLPGLPAYLPKQSYVKNSAKYVVGPFGLDRIGSPLPSQIVDFDSGAEVVLGNYDSSGGEATLLLISYPTPQIAGEHLRRIQAAQQPGQQSSGNPPLAGAMFEKRTGPIVVVAAGPLSPDEAKSLLASVNYEANVTWNENTFLSKKDNIGNLVWNALILCGILMVFALVAGLAFGGLRVLVQRIVPERIFHRQVEVEFISLHLSEKDSGPPDGNVSSSIKAV
ncbi:MAG: DUF6599 family protein [Terriglobales bacterium]